MFRQAHVLSFLFVFVAQMAHAVAQELSRDQFRTEFNQGLAIQDDKAMDKVMKRGARQAIAYFEELCFEKDKGNQAAADKVEALRGSWKRSFNGGDTLDLVERWANGQSTSEYEKLQKVRTQSSKLWGIYTDQVAKAQIHDDYTKVVAQFGELARQAESLGHYGEAAEQWGLSSVVANAVPDKTIADRKDAVFSVEQFLAARKAWNFTFDEHYIRNSEFAQFEKARIEEDEKKNDKRKDQGYDQNAKGIDALVMPNVAEVKTALKYEPLANWEELDYGPKAGPLPAFWWMTSLGKTGESREMTWFHRGKIFLHRDGAAKFSMSLSADDAKLGGAEIEATPKAKPSTFWLDAEKKVPYAMFFWLGSDREMVNEAECNLASSDTVANIYYRSAASWQTTIGKDELTLYDDNASGNPGDGDPNEPQLHMATLGDHEGEGLAVPTLDSMRIGKGPRVPYSEFVKLSTGWCYLKKGPGDDIGMRPLNPDYVKTGKIKLVWAGPKPTAPVELVVQGSGDYKSALFDVAGGKEIEVPAAEYKVIWGRLMNGKGVRAQVASLYQGDAKPFTVEAGKTFVLKMGAPFSLDYTRRGDQSTTIDALKILVKESSGCILTEFHNISLACEVMTAKSDDGKGAKPVGKFVRFTDPELVNKAAAKHNNLGLLTACWPMPDGYRDGELVLSLKLAAENLKVGLAIKKHPFFDKLITVWH